MNSEAEPLARLSKSLERILEARRREEEILSARHPGWQYRARALFKLEALRAQTAAIRQLCEHKLGLPFRIISKGGKIQSTLLAPHLAFISGRANVDYNAQQLRPFLWEYVPEDVAAEERWLDTAQADPKDFRDRALITEVVNSFKKRFNRALPVASEAEALDELVSLLEHYADVCERLTGEMYQLKIFHIGD